MMLPASNFDEAVVVPSTTGTDDAAMLRAWATNGSETAFRQLTDKYINLVFSIASRGVAGRRELAEEVTQNVFALLARKAAHLEAHPSICGWLYQTAVLEAKGTARRELKRLEKMKHLSNDEGGSAHASRDPWADALLHLDDAMNHLSPAERQLLLLRFYEGRGLRDIAASLGRTEAAVQRQGHRTLEKLRHLLSCRGAAVPAAALASGLAGQLSHAAPAGMASAVAHAAPLAAKSLSAATVFSNTLLTMSSVKSITTGAAILLVAVPVSYQWIEHRRLASGVHTLEQQAAGLSEAGSPQPQVARSGASGQPVVTSTPPPSGKGPHQLNARELLARFEAIGSGSSGQFNALLRSITDLPLEEKAALLLELRNLESQAKHSVMDALLAKLTEQDPEFAAGFVLKNHFPPYQISRVGSVWGSREPEAALAWLDRQMAAGAFFSDPTLAGGTESALRAGIIGGLASKDWPRAAVMVQGLPAEAQGYAAYPMVAGFLATKGEPEAFAAFAQKLAPAPAAAATKAYAGQLRANRTPQIAERLLTDPAVSPDVRNSVVLGLLDAEDPDEWKTSLPRLMELSDDAHRSGNVKKWFEWWSVQRADAAGAFIDALPADAPERDFALAGQAAQLARNNRGAVARERAAQISDVTLRSETLTAISSEEPPNINPDGRSTPGRQATDEQPSVAPVR